MGALRICPNCQYENAEDALKCAQCGMGLPTTKIETLRVADLLPELAAQHRKLTYYGKVHPGFVAIYVMGEAAPLLFEDRGTIVLGRSASGEDPPTVNLARYRANLLGVSRRHAAIRIEGGAHILMDLGSSNGTWVNDELLKANESYPLRNGDLVRLGHLVLHVYFQEGEKAAEAEAEIKADNPTVVTHPNTNQLGEVASATMTLIGRPGQVETHQDIVVARLLHLPRVNSADTSKITMPAVATRYAVYMGVQQWAAIKDEFNNPNANLVIEGICAYDSLIASVVVYATSVSIRVLEPTALPNQPDAD